MAHATTAHEPATEVTPQPPVLSKGAGIAVGTVFLGLYGVFMIYLFASAGAL